MTTESQIPAKPVRDACFMLLYIAAIVFGGAFDIKLAYYYAAFVSSLCLLSAALVYGVAFFKNARLKRGLTVNPTVKGWSGLSWWEYIYTVSLWILVLTLLWQMGWHNQFFMYLSWVSAVIYLRSIIDAYRESQPEHGNTLPE